MIHRISAGAIVVRDDRVLLVRHALPGQYDFWVCPGGGALGDESLEEAAAREVREETGLEASIGRLLYVEELVHPEARHVKFWFAGEVASGEPDCSRPEAVAEWIVEARWLARPEFAGTTVFPPMLANRYWQDRSLGFPGVVRLPLRRMEFW